MAIGAGKGEYPRIVRIAHHLIETFIDIGLALIPHHHHKHFVAKFVDKLLKVSQLHSPSRPEHLAIARRT